MFKIGDKIKRKAPDGDAFWFRFCHSNKLNPEGIFTVSNHFDKNQIEEASKSSPHHNLIFENFELVSHVKKRKFL